jgi:type III secretory pathway component EscV
MEFAWGIVALIGIVVGGLIMMFGFDFGKKEQKPAAFGHVDGVVKQEWTRTGNIDFHATALESASPQPLILRIEEKKITENAMGQDIVELRWRLATLEEAKEVVVCWNARQSE